MGLAVSAAFQVFVKAYPKPTNVAAQFCHKEFEGTPSEFVDVQRSCFRQLPGARSWSESPDFKQWTSGMSGCKLRETRRSPLALGRGVAFFWWSKSQSRLTVSFPEEEKQKYTAPAFAEACCAGFKNHALCYDEFMEAEKSSNFVNRRVALLCRESN